MHKEFYLPHSYFEPEDYSGDYETTLSKSQIDHIRDHLDGLIKQIFSIEPLNMDVLETNIEEICHLLMVEMPRSAPMISHQCQLERNELKKPILVEEPSHRIPHA